MLAWFNDRRARKARQKEAQLLLRLDRAELHAAVSELDYRRNNIEDLMRRMLEERQEGRRV